MPNNLPKPGDILNKSSLPKPSDILEPVKKKEATPAPKKKGVIFSPVTDLLESTLATSKPKTAQKPLVSSGGKAKQQVFTGYPGKGDKKYILDESTGTPIWKEDAGTGLVVGNKPVSAPISVKINITDPARVAALNKHFNQNAGASDIEEVFVGVPGKETNKYRVYNGNWERMQPTATKWTTLTDATAITALNNQFKKKVKIPTVLQNVVEDNTPKFADINSKLVSNTEETVVPYLQNKYGNLGFSFEQSGMGTDYVTVTAKNGKTMEVGLDESNPTEALKLRTFLDLNKSDKSTKNNNIKELRQKISDIPLPDGSLSDSINKARNSAIAEGNKKLNEYLKSDQYVDDFKSLDFYSKKKEIDIYLNDLRRNRNTAGNTGNQSEINRTKDEISNFYNSDIYKIYKKDVSKQLKDRTDQIDKLYYSLKQAKTDDQKKVIKQQIDSYLSNNFIQDQTNNYNIQLNDVSNSYKKIETETAQYQKDLNEFNQKVNSGQIDKEQYDAMSSEFIQRAEDIDNKNLEIKKSGNAVVSEMKKLETVAGKYLLTKEKIGGFWGNMLNSTVSGVSKIIEFPVGLAASYSGDLDYEMLDPQIKNYLKDKKYSKEESINYLANKRQKQVKEVVKSSLIETLGTSSTTEEYRKSADRGFFEKALAGVAESLPAMLVPGGAAARISALGTQAYSSIEDEMLNDPDFETTSVKDRSIITVPYAIGMGILENIGVTTMMSKNPLAKSLIAKSLLSVAGKIGGNTTKKVFESVLEKEIKSNIAKFGLKVIGGTLAEAETGATQSLVLDIGLKGLYNIYKDKTDGKLATDLSQGEYFDTPDSFSEGAAMVLEDAAAEAIGGMVMTSVGTSYEKIRNGDISLYNAKDVDFLKSIAEDSEIKKIFIAKLKTGMLSGKITKSEAQNQLDAMNDVQGLFNKIPDNITGENLKSALTLTLERNKLEKEIAGKDENLVASQKARVAEINNELTKISEDATKESNVQEVSTSEYQRTGEGQQEVGISEGGKRETTQPEADRGDSVVTSEVQQEEVDAKQAEVDSLWDEKTILQAELEDQGLTEEEVMANPDFRSKADKFDVAQSELFNLQDKASAVQPTEQDQVATLRAEEQAELSDVIPNIEDYKVNGEVDKTLMTPEDLTKYNEIYDKYDKLITPLLPATKEGPTVEQEVEAIGQLLSGTDQEIDQKAYTIVNKKISKAVARAAKAVSKVIPGTKFIVHDTDESYRAATKEEGLKQSSNGEFNAKTNTIHINGTSANNRTVAHEVFHAILINKVKTDKNAADITKRMIEAIWLKVDVDVNKKLNDFISNYDENIQNEEKLAELVGVLAENYNSFSTSVKDTIFRWIDKLAKISKLDPFNRNETYDMLNTIARKVAKGKVISEADINMMSITGVTTNIVESTEPRKQVKVSKDQKLTFVTKEDIIDIDSLISDISSKKQKVWFWVADQLGRGNYFDSVLNGEHFLDAGPSFALDPENRSNNVIWASGAKKKTLDNNIAKSDYIFIISGSPQRSKLFNKTVTNLIRRRIEGAIEFNNFKKELLESKPTSKIKSILEKYNSYEDLFMGADRKNFIIAINEQQTKNTLAKKVLEKYNAFVDPNDLRDGFYQDNNFEMGDIMLVLKADKLGEKSKHSTYETDILGSVVGVPDKKINSYDIMPSEIKDKYRDDMSRSEQSQVVAPYGIGIKEISSRKQLAPELSNKLTEDKSGNFVFHHYSNDNRDVIKPGTGENIITGKEEGGALSAVGGLAMYYTMDNQVEPGVGNVLHTVLVPNGKVYDFNSDPENFYDEAKKRFEVARPSQSFSPNYQLAFITQVANENGYDMVVARWRNNELRAQTTMSLEASKDNVSMKPIAEETYKVGDDVEVYGSKGKITSIDGDMITFKGDGVGGGINFKRFPKNISKQITPRKQIAEEVTGIEESISPRKQKPKTINDIVKLTKDQGFSDAAIRQYLKDQGYSDKNINDAMEPDTGDVTVSKIREASQKELMARQKKLTIRDRIRAIRNKFIDRQSDIKRLIKGIGSKESIRAYNLLVNKAGASGFANYRFKNAEADIYKDLKKNDLDTLDDIIYARRMVAINESRAKQGAEPYTGMDGYSEVKALKDLDAIKNKIGEKKFNDLSERATKYFGVFSENLKKLYESGRINEETYINLRDIEYSPIRTIKYIIGDNLDPATVDREASKLGVSKKDIMALTDSNENAIIFDSKWLLMLNVMSVEGRAFENKMLNEFSDAIDGATQEQRDAMSEFIIDNPIVKQTSTGSIQYKYNQNNVPIGYSIVSFFKNGVKTDLVVKDEYATQLLDIKSSNQALNLIGTLTGAKILRFFATGGNPLFIIGNTAVDFQNILFFSDVYSKFKLVGGAQLSYDFVRKFLKGVATKNRKNVIYNEYVEHGGAMDFLSNDGLRALKSLSPKNKILNISQKVLVGYGNIMSYLGEKSELAFRLAVYDKVKGDEISKFKKENGRDPDAKELDDIMYEATRNARETMDFNQGGTWVKTADNVMPYLNASMQGFRRPLEYAKNNPLGFTSSLVQAAVMAGSVAALSLAALMRSVGDDEEEKKKVLEVLDSLSDYEKATYHIIFTGKKDKDGEYEYYRVKKLPVLSVMSTVAEQFTYKYLLSEAGIKYDVDQEVINKSISASTPFSPSDIASRNPLISGLLTYSFNWDSFTGEKIFREPRDKKIAASAEGMYDDKVEEIYKKIAPSLGLSPIRTKAAIEKIVTSENTNPMISIFYASVNGFFNKDGYGAEFSDAFSNVFDASARKLKRTTNKDNIRYKEEDKIENQEMIIETDIYNKEQKVYNTIKNIYKDGKELSNGELVDLIKTNFEKKDQEKYAKKYYAYIKNMNIDRSILDILYEETPEVQALRLYNRYGSELDSEEKKILSEVMGKAKMKLSKQALYIYDKKYSKRK
jgi:hypothetical protein